MPTKIYTHENVTFQAKGRRWEFKADRDGKQVYSYGTPVMPGGRETAVKVANIINGAVKRSGSMDNLGRANMSAVFHKAQKATSRVVNSQGLFA